MSQLPEIPAEGDAVALAAFREHVKAALAVAQREQQISRRLRRRGLYLVQGGGGYAIAGFRTHQCQAFGLTLDAAEAWSKASAQAPKPRVPTGRPRI